ncbi:hypothetical protein ACFOKI_16375 [Sphingomonas qilianensis]|uniref:N-acetyltransferase domain-containing protein n=1 Tax=Sphingomonas qilianensis TaxID=1736690 RepID=A0ABU9XWP0_9SPHN
MFQEKSAPPSHMVIGGALVAENYSFTAANAPQLRAYHDLIRTTYEPLGFLNDHADAFMPRDGTQCYVLCYLDEVVGSCSLTPVQDEQSVFNRFIPGQTGEQRARMIELNNIILVPELRGGIGLSLILYHATLRAMEDGAELVVGITRYQTLRHFVEAGAIPVNHEPLHLLGREDLHDFVIYYDVRSPDALTYLRERARRLFGQALTLKDIKVQVAARERGVRVQQHPSANAQAA